jgi:hypothetical protein
VGYVFTEMSSTPAFNVEEARSAITEGKGTLAKTVPAVVAASTGKKRRRALNAVEVRYVITENSGGNVESVEEASFVTMANGSISAKGVVGMVYASMELESNPAENVTISVSMGKGNPGVKNAVGLNYVSMVSKKRAVLNAHSLKG